MAKQRWTLRQWANFLAAMPAGLSLIVLAVCSVILVTWWTVYSGYFVMLGCIITLFFGAFVIVSALIRR